MPLEGDQQEDYPGDTSQKIPTPQGGHSSSGVPPAGGRPDPPPTPSEENQLSQSSSKWRENTKTSLEIFGVVLLCAYTWFSCLQWLQIRYTNTLTARALDSSDSSLGKTLDKMQGQIAAIDNGNTQAKNALLATQRAFLYVVKFNISAIGDHYKVSFQWSNGGTTPTRLMRQNTHIQMFHGKLPSSFNLHKPGEQGFPMFVGPKADSNGPNIVVPVSDLNSIANHKGRLYFWGWAEYSDVFPGTTRHITQFCSEITDVVYTAATNTTNIVTAPCDRGNCTDDECKNQ